MHPWYSPLKTALMRLPAAVRHIGLGACLGALAALLMLAPPSNVFGRLLARLEQATLDYRYHARINILGPANPVISDIIIVDIDRYSVSKMGRYARWPRSFHADVLDHLTEDGARIIGLDILFDGVEEDEHDRRLAEAAGRAGNVYTALFLLPADSLNYQYAMETNPYASLNPHSILPVPPAVRKTFYTQDYIEGPFSSLARSARGLVAVTTSPDLDGAHRWIPLIMNFGTAAYASMSLRIAMDMLGIQPDEVRIEPGQRIRLGERRVIPIDDRGRMLLRYYGRGGANGGTFRYVSYYDVYQRRFPAGMFTDKIVLIGSSLPGQGDLASAPFSAAFPGVEIHATAIQNIVTGEFLTRMPPHITRWLILGLGVLVGVCTFLVRPLKGGIVVIVLMFACFLTAFAVFLQNAVWMEMIRPEGAMLLAYIAPLLFQYCTEEREKRRIRKAFEHYLAPPVVEELIRDPGKLKLGGERREVTMLFSDLADFAAIAEERDPETLLHLLNDYLTEMSDIILAYDGLIDKYEGDCIVAIFGAPVHRADHATRACLAAIDMQRRLHELRTQWMREGKPAFHARTGIHSGEVIVGNMGSKRLMDYTVTGDHANLACRLEGVNKNYGTQILISEMTYKQARDHICVRELDIIRVKGKRRSIRIYEALGRKEEALSQATIQALDHYAEGLAAYREQRWDEAEASFTQALAADPDDGPSRIFLRRCAALACQPPAPEWDGVFQIENK